MLTIDGTIGEGGGQILRSALTMSLWLGQPFRMIGIRARRKKSGLLAQHLTAIRAAAEISDARTEGAQPGSHTLSFFPGTVRSGHYHFATGTAGSVTLVLQTVLLPLLLANGSSRLTLEGGTHNPNAPTFEFLEAVFFPVLQRMGGRLKARLVRPGFYPAGGGRMEVVIEPLRQLHPISLTRRGGLLRNAGVLTIAGLPGDIAARERKTLVNRLGWEENRFETISLSDSVGPGNVISLRMEFEHVTEVFSGFGRRGVRAEAVAEGVAEGVVRYLAAEVPVGIYLADQLLLPIVMAGSGIFRTLIPSAHTLTNADVIEQFTGTRLKMTREGKDTVRIGL